MDDYKIIIEQEHSTVMAHYDIPKKDAEGYQSEAKLEAAFIKQLQGQGYEYVKVKAKAASLPRCAEQEDDGEPFAEKMQRLTSELSGLFAESRRLEDEIRKQLNSIEFTI